MKKHLTSEEKNTLLQLLKTRFEKHKHRHPDIAWPDVQARLEARPDKLWSLQQMEETQGEPDVIGRDEKSGEYLFVDCSPETPKGRRNVCYDREALDSRKEHKPHDSAVDLAAAMGIGLLDEAQYRQLQELGEFDAKTSSWIVTPPAIRQHGGALFGDRRYEHVFVYHNGAQSYYSSRAFRGLLRV